MVLYLSIYAYVRAIKIRHPPARNDDKKTSLVMNIAKRMILLICLSATGLLAIGLVGLFQMNTIHEKLDETGTNVVPSLIKLAEAENAFMFLRAQVLYHLLTEDPATLAEQERTLEHTRLKLETALNDYQAFVSDAKDQQYLNDSKALLARYLAEAPKRRCGREGKRHRVGSRWEVDGRTKAPAESVYSAARTCVGCGTPVSAGWGALSG